MQTLPRIGDRVRIPWGLTEVEGEVIAAYDSGKEPMVTTEVFLEGMDEGVDEPLTVTYPAEVVHPA
jgi:hypothetical protein